MCSTLIRRRTVRAPGCGGTGLAEEGGTMTERATGCGGESEKSVRALRSSFKGSSLLRS